MAAHGVGRLRIGVLGELQCVDESGALKLPQSRKTRALLAYLVISGREHRRDRLCSLLWDITDDPRGALRWSLSKLRQVVDSPEVRRIDANRLSVRFDSNEAEVDLALVQSVCSKIGEASTDELVTAASLFRGEFLEGSDQFDLDEFQGWLVAMREEALKLRMKLARTLLERLSDEPERALSYARVLVSAAPLDEQARCQLVQLLWSCGREREAEAQIAVAQRSFVELGSQESIALRDLGRDLRKRASLPELATASSDVEPTPSFVPRSPLARTTIHGLRMVGRQAEISSLAEKLDQVRDRQRAQVVIIEGEPGVGKSRMLVSLIVEARKRRGGIIEGCAYEAESGRVLGPWIDALARIPKRVLGSRGVAELEPLIAKSSASNTAETRDRLFQSVVNLLVERCQDSAPLLLALDDLQWFDEASLELLHYVVRYSSRLPILIALTVRDGELADNLLALRAIRGIRRAANLEEFVLGPLDRDQTAELVRLIEVKHDIEEIYRESGGNPLFALEVARSVGRSDSSARSSLSDVVRDRIEGLPYLSGDVLRWAAVLGPVFSVRTLAALVKADASELGEALDALERHALIGGVLDVIDPGSTYQFSHHLVRRVVYAELSSPRRRLMHQRVVGVLRPAMDEEDERAVELLHHASEAGNPIVAAEACAVAASRCLRLFAPGQAESLLRRGMRQLDGLDQAKFGPLRERLQHLLTQAGIAREERPASAP